MRPFSLLMKPVGGRCNLACQYCFYRDHASGAMADEVLEHMLKTYAALPFADKAVALQGGEPLLAGARILDKVAAYPVARSLQTNATLVTDEIAAKLARGGWLVGASVDGPKALHEAGRGASFDAAVQGVRRLEKARVDYNLLTVVSQTNVHAPEEVYRFLRDTFATRFHQYIECTGPDKAFAIGGEAWGEFLVRLFDAWIAQDAHTVSVRLFDSIVSQLVHGAPTQCSFSDTCRHYLVVEHDGSVYPCDFHVMPELKLGNVMTDDWQTLLASPVYERFARAKTARLPAKCLSCEWLSFCRGDCPRNRQSLCAGWKRFFAHAVPKLAELI